jgi:hypothetical protein
MNCLHYPEDGCRRFLRNFIIYHTAWRHVLENRYLNLTVVRTLNIL